MAVRIFHICPDFENTKLYGRLISHIESEEFKNTVFVPGEEKNHIDYPFKRIYYDRKFSTLSRLIFFTKQCRIFREIQRQPEIADADITHAHFLFSSGYCALLAKRKMGIPYVVSVRNTDVNVFFKWMVHLRGLGVRILLEAESVVFISPAYRNTVLDKYVPKKYRKRIEEKSCVIPNAIDNIFFDDSRAEEKKIENDRITVLYAGQVNSNKNLLTTISACEKLISKGYDVKYLVAGEMLEPKYESVFKKKEFVDYRGEVRESEVRDLMRMSDVFVMPSISETFGLVYVEALSQGLPIIYSKGQGIDGYFKEGEVGYGVNSTDADELTDRILDIIADYESMSRAAARASQSFKWPIVAEKFRHIYESHNLSRR